MDRDQHIAQDAAEHYAVYVMAKTAERLGVASRLHSAELFESFTDYLNEKSRQWDYAKFDSIYPNYKINVDFQVPHFVERLREKFPVSAFEFQIDEAAFRNLGLKADFTVAIDSEPTKRHVSLKNYVGTGGIERPQVSSGTFLSFAAGFVFERNGVGTYVDPRTGGKFKGSNELERNAVLRHQGRHDLIDPLQRLADLQTYIRDELLTLRFYDSAKIKATIAQIVPLGQQAMLDIFYILGINTVRTKFLERVGLDGLEDVLYFDKKNFLDSITNARFEELRSAINDPSTEFKVAPAGQSLRFQFVTPAGSRLLSVDVPLTINTNGAWFRDLPVYEGTRPKVDKGHTVDLAWGQLRPYKSRELATSTNAYIDLKSTGIFKP